MRHASVFTGIGGFDLAAQWMGWQNVFQVEIDPYCQKVLEKNFPTAKKYGDIRQFNGEKYRGSVDILTGGWPCQDNSRAKQCGDSQKGMQGERSGLFLEYERIIRQIRPAYLIGENVPDILTINGGRDFNYILSALASMGYNVTWGVLRASDIGAPHHRERLYMVADASGKRLQTLHAIWRNAREKIERRKSTGLFNGASISVGGAWESEPPFLRVDDAIPNRSHRFKALGNSVIPHIAFEIFKAIEQVK